VSDDRRHSWNERYRRDAPARTPSAFVAHALDVLDADAGRAAMATGGRRALDVACGPGRHALLLAARGWAVDAVDYALPALTTLRHTARDQGLAVRCIAADVAQWPLPPERYALVVVVSFLDRSLWPALRAAVAPGGALLAETFVADPACEPPPLEPGFVLAPGELDDVCRAWEILARHAGTTTHHDVIVARAGILARRPR
jgi:SAM-dependent methyltransferase